jgi:hypothetical protein
LDKTNIENLLSLKQDEMASSMVSASNLTNIAPNIDYAMEYFLPLPKGPVNEKFNSIYKE